MKRILFFPLCCLVVISSCIGQKYNFDNKDLEVINLYEVGDTLVFQSNSNTYDTILISSKETRFNGFSEGYSGNPQTCWIKYKPIPKGEPELVSSGKSVGRIYSTERLFLTAVKSNPSKPARIDIEFGEIGSIPVASKLKNNDEFGSHYNIVHYCIDCNGIKPTDIVEIIWKVDVGIVQYKWKNGKVWSLIKG